MLKQINLEVSDNFSILLNKLSDKYGMSPNSYISHLLLVQDILNTPILKMNTKFDGTRKNMYILAEQVVELMNQQANKHQLKVNEYLYQLLLNANEVAY
ncbi:hypothetical protein KHQ81_15605 (plasmid) [Mycoplasmatota bacterium]|nr:hypothetical protein KHQ81_15605 [Mycoplasmatota bacterium]